MVIGAALGVGGLIVVFFILRNGAEFLTKRDKETGRTVGSQIAVDLAKVLAVIVGAFVLLRAPWQWAALLGAGVAATTATARTVASSADAGSGGGGASGGGPTDADRICAPFGGLRLEAGGYAICADDSIHRL